MPQETFKERLSLKKLEENKWETTQPPDRLGNALPIAYGGFALGVAAQAASLAAPDGYYLYSMNGNFLGPATTDRPMLSSIQVLRKTRTFFTCQVIVGQKMDSGEERSCLVALADFQLKEKAILMEFSAKPRREYSHHSNLSSIEDSMRRAAAEGKVLEEQLRAFEKTFGLMTKYFDLRTCPEGIFAQNLNGMAKSVQTTQDDLPITQKSTAEWVRCSTPLPSAADQMATLAFYMDGALSFSPLVFDHKNLEDSAACSSLDFSLRVFSSEVDLTAWSLKEIVTHAGAEGRTYSEGRLFDEGGKLVACMTQQSILRAWPEKKGDKGKL